MGKSYHKHEEYDLLGGALLPQTSVKRGLRNEKLRFT